MSTGTGETKDGAGKESQVGEGTTEATTTDGMPTKEGIIQKLFTFGTPQQSFEAVDYSDSYAATKNYYLRFKHLPSGLTISVKGFITSFSDNFTSNWNSQPAYGRMDDIRTFQNTTRQINMAFVMPAFDYDEARCNLTKVTKLMRKLYPHYAGADGNNASSITKAPLMRVEFVNLVSDGRYKGGGGGLLGTVNGFSFTPNLEHGFFDYANYLYPKTIDISFTFDVLHEHIVGWTDTESGGSQWADGDAAYFPYAFPYTGPGSFAESQAAQEPTTADEEASLLDFLD